MAINLEKTTLMPRKNWTPAEVKYLQDNYGNIRVAEMMQVMGRSRNSIERKATKLGLRSRRPGSPVWANAAANLIHYTGRDHWAYREIGEVWAITDGRQYTKNENGEVEPYARYLMRKAGYRIDGMVVRHKDGDHTNCQLDNLEVITPGEHGIKNSQNCKDPELRRIRHRVSRGITSFVDEILMGAFVEG